MSAAGWGREGRLLLIASKAPIGHIIWDKMAPRVGCLNFTARGRVELWMG